MIVQPGLCRTWSETPKTSFLTSRLICYQRLDQLANLHSPRHGKDVQRNNDGDTPSNQHHERSNITVTDSMFVDRTVMANSADPDEEQSNMGLQCLPFHLHHLEASVTLPFCTFKARHVKTCVNLHIHAKTKAQRLNEAVLTCTHNLCFEQE